MLRVIVILKLVLVFFEIFTVKANAGVRAHSLQIEPIRSGMGRSQHALPGDF